MSFTRIVRSIGFRIYRLAMMISPGSPVPPGSPAGRMASPRNHVPRWSRVRGAASEPHCLTPTSAR
jgi:hypothetical protein